MNYLGGSSDSDLRSLHDWLDRHAQNPRGARAGIAGGVIGGLWGLWGGMIGVLTGAFNVDPMVGVGVPVALGTLSTVLGIAWYYRGLTSEEREAQRARGQMSPYVWKLVTARWTGSLKNLLGEAGAIRLNEAAYEYIRCQNALASAAWRERDADSPWGRARQQTRHAMEIGMARTVTALMQGASAEDPEVVQMVEDMRQAADAAVTTASRLARRRGAGGDASTELRKALGEMRALEEAEDEIFLDQSR
jgi:hypothetical protein